MNSLRYGVDRFSDRKTGHPDRPATLQFSGLTITGNSKMKTIQLTQGKVAIIDNEDFELLNQYKWRAMRHLLKLCLTNDCQPLFIGQFYGKLFYVQKKP